MWMANLLVAVIVLGFAGYQYFKGTVVKSFATMMGAIFASIAAFGYFEILGTSMGKIGFIADLLAKKGTIGWLQNAAFLIIFGLILIISLTIIEQLAGKTLEMGLWPERIGRVLFGGLGGIIIAGALLTALMLSPLANGKPYQRFETSNTSKAKKVLLHADDFVAGLFGHVSKMSLSGERSFSVVHADFLDEVALTKLSLEKDEGLSLANEINKVVKVRPAPENLKIQETENSAAENYKVESGKKPLIVQVEFNNGTKISSLLQVRLICKTDGQETLSGEAKNIYPEGVMSGNVMIKKPFEKATETGTEEDQSQNKKRRNRKSEENTDSEQSSESLLSLVDFVFAVPNDYKPIAVGFKRSSIAELPKKITEGKN